MVLDSVPGVHENYWQKSYVGKVDEEGRFTVEITEPSPAPGTLKFLFCFRNGAVTGDGKQLGLSGSLDRSYVVSRDGYQWSKP